MNVHLDTDFGGDTDDLCALAMLLRWPGVEITGITTVAEVDGRRAGQVRQALRIAGRSGIPVAAGADNAGGYYPYHLGLPDEAAYWPETVVPAPGPLDAALDLIGRSIDQGRRSSASVPSPTSPSSTAPSPGVCGRCRSS